jgi:phosphopantothenoylcysteine decarboxylase/phosphopantothenate--cysteine ligase
MSSKAERPRRILLGVCGGVAAFKSVLLLRRLQDAGFEVRVVMTDSATRFVGEATMHALSGHRVYRQVWRLEHSSSGELHVDLTAWADAIVIYPATANFAGGLSAGLADDLLKLCVSCFDGPVLVCPAMHSRMASHPLHEASLVRLTAAGLSVLPCESGRLASGEMGEGRLPEPEVALEAITALLTPQDLAGRRVVVSAGPTREALDPVRFLSNHSTGRMGYALARVAARRGADVTLVSGPTQLQPPLGVTCVQVEDAAAMAQAVRHSAEGADALVMAAAVADFRPAAHSEHKLAKGEGGGGMELQLERTQDILASITGQGRPRVVVGFAMETRDLLERARGKLEAKGLDLVVANDLSEPGAGFAGDTNVVTLLHADGRSESLPLMSKDEVSAHVLDRIALLLSS